MKGYIIVLPFLICLTITGCENVYVLNENRIDSVIGALILKSEISDITNLPCILDMKS